MSVMDALRRRAALSLEVFPPKTDAGMEKLCGSVLPQLYTLRPDSISCTYSPGGSDAGKNLAVLDAIRSEGRCAPFWRCGAIPPASGLTAIFPPPPRWWISSAGNLAALSPLRWQAPPRVFRTAARWKRKLSF